MALRWGIVSTASIGHKNWQAIQLSGNGVVAAVASRNLDSSNRHIDLCQQWCSYPDRPEAFANYLDLVTSPDIDAVYVPLPTGQRKQIVIAAASAGKHVLCEKPCAVSAEDLQQMINACQVNHVQFMDGVMYMHTKRLQQMKQAIANDVGDIKRINCQFSFRADQKWLETNIRTHSDLEPQGCLGDLGWYCIRYILWAMDWQVPQDIRASIISQEHRPESPEPVPTEFSAEMFFANNVSASFYCSFITHHQQWANISGTNGYLHVNDFVLPYRGEQMDFEISNAEFVTEGCDFEMIDHRKKVTASEHANSAKDSQETQLFRNFADLALSGTLDPHWPKISLLTQQVLDDCLATARQ